jgi:hypothetical protein
MGTRANKKRGEGKERVCGVTNAITLFVTMMMISFFLHILEGVMNYS